MRATPAPLLDDRRAAAIVEEFLRRRAGYLPDWNPQERGHDSAMPWIFARYLEAILSRLNDAPEKNKLAFLDLLGVNLIPAQSARVPVVFAMHDDVPPTFAEAGTQVVAPPAPESNGQIVFETEQRVGLMSKGLSQIVSLWPGRDEYIDHTPQLESQEAIALFRKRDLRNTPHHLYLAHDELLALAGNARVRLHVELIQRSRDRLDVVWQYWDGKIWRAFLNQQPECLNEQIEKPDGTSGFRASGEILLTSECAEVEKTTINGHESFWIRGVLQEPLPPDPSRILPIVDSMQISTEIVQLDPALVEFGVQQSIQKLGDDAAITKLVQGAVSDGGGEDAVSWLEPDNALFGLLPLDTSQTFYPLGQAPVPGDVFYISSEEIFSKPRAEVTVQIALAETPSSKFDAQSGSNGSTPLSPDVSWQYWNGRRWTDLAIEEITNQKPAEFASDFLCSGLFRFSVPDDLEPTTVDNEEALWIRAYLVKEGFGITATVRWNDGNTGDNSYTYVVYQAPAIEKFRMGYTWQIGPYHPERVIAYNDFQYRDYTPANKWPGEGYRPFELMRDTTPTVYLGFEAAPPVERLNMFLDVVEAPGEIHGPPLQWEFWDGFNWAHLLVEDETNHLRVPGMISWIGQKESRAVARFGRDLHWLRGRLKEDGPPGEPVIQEIHPNAVWASHRQTIADEPIGTSTGQPDQAFNFRQIPILPGEIIEVRELAGQRANVEWRMLVLELLGDDYRHIQSIEDELRREGSQADIQRDDLRLRRDRNKRVTEVWVRWQRREHLFGSSEDDRHYVLERSTGRLIFGNGRLGKVPPMGAAIQARRFTTGGGLDGNIPAGAIEQLLGSVPGADGVTNPRAAEGGADAESLQNYARRGPLTLRHRGRALTASDYETMAREASPAVAFARALPNRDPAHRERPGWLTLVIIPNGEEKRPWPSFGLREHVRRCISERAPATLVAADGIFVTGPQYMDVDVRARVAPRPEISPGEVERVVRSALLEFFHPLRGGPFSAGWDPGRPVYQSDVASLLARQSGVDYVDELALLLDGGLQGDHARIPASHIAAAGQFSIQVIGRD